MVMHSCTYENSRQISLVCIAETTIILMLNKVYKQLVIKKKTLRLILNFYDKLWIYI